MDKEALSHSIVDQPEISETGLHLVEGSKVAAIGGGLRTIQERRWDSFDGYLLGLAIGMGAQVIPKRISNVNRKDGMPQVHTSGSEPMTYALLVMASGMNTSALKLFDQAIFNYLAPRTTKTAIRENFMGMDTISRYMGSSMHVFLLDLPRPEFAALIPKGDYVTVCLLGKSIDAGLLKALLNTPQVKSRFPPSWNWEDLACKAIENDNNVGRVIFLVVRLIQRFRFARRAVLHMVSKEQAQPGGNQHMSMALWDTFTDSASYRDVFLRTLHPAFIGGYLWNMFRLIAD